MATSFGWTLVAMFVLIAALFLPVAVSARGKVAESVYAEPEVRAVWLTTNGGLDWPGRTRGEEAQKRELTAMLDRLAGANFNLVIFQVQANGDVLWRSKYEPAMEEITGNGKMSLDFDVCRFIIDECHKRSMECHAWIVPFRMGSTKQIDRYRLNKVSHPGRMRRKQCVAYHGVWWLDPGIPDNRKWLVGLYRELVRAYDFDGINLDYTRYPGGDFPDSHTYRKYAPGRTSLNDWRRDNLNRFVEDLYKMVSEERPDMMVGSAPIGTYKNVGKLRNATAYDSYCQDPVAWTVAGCHDLVIPQMYWDEKFGYSVNLDTWSREVSDNAPVVAGLAAYKMAEGSWDDEVIVDQIRKARGVSGISGVAFFRAQHVIGTSPKARRLYGRLVNELFATPVPLPWASAVNGIDVDK